MELQSIWKEFRFPTCELCKKECQGHLDYDNLCSNVNYLREYGEKNYEKNKQSFEALKELVGEKSLNIFSFGCGLGLDYLGAVDVFDGSNVNYFGIDESDWAIKDTENYKNFQPDIPRTVNFEEGLFLLTAAKRDVVLCFFNSLFTISQNTDDLISRLVEALSNKQNFYIVCDYTINNNYHMPKEEQNFLAKLLRTLSAYFSFKRFEILDGRGIIISAIK